ncbi:hypothetical protein BXY64_2134 [Marinifilum flexuosum]|uniref:Uncharacterized protein n=1 Tax=Marinifilum flexuosum TaxID=1117708 RepID=A0A419X2X9_9BACT|nr:hypothetical protein BXY64_2134 [Marinifilum flexuosum]
MVTLDLIYSSQNIPPQLGETPSYFLKCFPKLGKHFIFSFYVFPSWGRLYFSEWDFPKLGKHLFFSFRAFPSWGSTSYFHFEFSQIGEAPLIFISSFPILGRGPFSHFELSQFGEGVFFQNWLPQILISYIFLIDYNHLTLQYIHLILFLPPLLPLILNHTINPTKATF